MNALISYDSSSDFDSDSDADTDFPIHNQHFHPSTSTSNGIKLEGENENVNHNRVQTQIPIQIQPQLISPSATATDETISRSSSNSTFSSSSLPSSSSSASPYSLLNFSLPLAFLPTPQFLHSPPHLPVDLTSPSQLPLESNPFSTFRYEFSVPTSVNLTKQVNEWRKLFNINEYGNERRGERGRKLMKLRRKDRRAKEGVNGTEESGGGRRERMEENYGTNVVQETGEEGMPSWKQIEAEWDERRRARHELDFVMANGPAFPVTSYSSGLNPSSSTLPSQTAPPMFPTSTSTFDSLAAAPSKRSRIDSSVASTSSPSTKTSAPVTLIDLTASTSNAPASSALPAVLSAAAEAQRIVMDRAEQINQRLKRK